MILNTTLVLAVIWDQTLVTKWLSDWSIDGPDVSKKIVFATTSDESVGWTWAPFKKGNSKITKPEGKIELMYFPPKSCGNHIFPMKSWFSGLRHCQTQKHLLRRRVKAAEFRSKQNGMEHSTFLFYRSTNGCYKDSAGHRYSQYFEGWTG